MAESAPALYVLDTNVLMDWQARYYPTDVFHSMLGLFDELIALNRSVAPELVEEELEAVGTTELSAWAAHRPTCSFPLSELLGGLIDSGRFQLARP